MAETSNCIELTPRRTVNPMILFMAVLMLLSSSGCEEQYKGSVFQTPVDKVALFDLEGPDGEDVTRQLGTELNACGKVVVYGSEFGEPADSIAAAKIARDNNAGAYILGDITKNGIVTGSQYEIHGTFTLHDAKNGDQIGGIADAHYGENIDGLSDVGGTLAGGFDFLEGVFGNKNKPNEKKHIENINRTAESKKPLIYQRFARKVAGELVRGLGREIR